MEAIERWLHVSSESGSGSGSSSGSGSGSGSGYGYGSGSGSSSGSGSGYSYGYSYGYGYGSGSGYGSGYGSGDGSGDGYGSGSGSGSGSGYGSGYGDGIMMFGRHTVYMIDDELTIIYHLRGQIAVGAIIRDDLTLADCYVAKVGNCFAHGKTAQEAVADATAKYNESRPLSERIAAFVAAFPKGVKKPASDYFSWHHILTGSCMMGRENFCREHGISMGDLYTPEEFIDITANAYGGKIIKQLKTYYNED